jgi:SAM-dependent methyltransferase
MALHWDWAIEQALSLYKASHFSFLTDRMLFKPGALDPLLEIVTAYPDKILTYMHDMVDDFSTPVVVRQYPWTGQLYEVPSTRLLEMSAQGVMYDTCLPRMLNCIVPRKVLEAIRDRFGNSFAPIAPDWNFCYRALALVDSILFHDKAALVHYAQRRSNGLSSHYGTMNEAYSRFRQDLGALPVNFAAPFPEIVTVWNAIISEYCHTKELTQSPKFPKIDLYNYGKVLAWGIDQIIDPQRQEEMRAHLSARGWKSQEAAPPPPAAAAPATEEGLPDKQTPRVAKFSVNAIEFPSSTEALSYALNHAREREKAARSEHETLIQGVKRALPQELFGSYASLIPPLDLMHDGPIGYQEFKENGEEFFRYYTGLCGLKPHEKMLDIGSGIGRKTFLLTDYLREPGGYEGLDIVKAGIDWCTERITRRNPSFRFQLIDVCNQHYNPAGKYKASDYEFPFADESFDLVVLASVFTHMLPDDVENYLSEAARVLRRGGRCFISFFLLNEESKSLLRAGKSSIALAPGAEPCWVAEASAPEKAIGYEEDFILSLYDKHNLDITRPIQYGSWCGRETFLSYQDLILAFKPIG